MFRRSSGAVAARKVSKKGRPSLIRPVVEVLGPRCMLSASIQNTTLWLEGSDGDDVIVVERMAGAGSIVVTGVAGVADGTVYQSIGFLSIRGLGGNDTIEARNFAARDTSLHVDMFGGEGDDLLIGVTGPDLVTYWGGAGNDSIRSARHGMHTLSYAFAQAGARIEAVGSAGATTDDGDGGHDTFEDVFRVHGSMHDDMIVLGGGWQVDGSSGNDTITAGSSSTLIGGSGDDVLTGTDFCRFSPGAGNDSIAIGGWEGALEYRDVMNGLHVRLDQGEVLDDGFGGRDVIAGRVAKLQIWSSFDDLVYGDAGNNWIETGGGNDTVEGGGGIDCVNGVWFRPPNVAPYQAGEQRLVIEGSAGDDVITIVAGAKPGEVRVFGAPNITDGMLFTPVTSLSVLAGAGNDRVEVAGDVILTFSDDHTSVCWIAGGDGDDVLIGGSMPTLFAPGRGNDVIVSGSVLGTLSYGQDEIAHGAVVRLDRGVVEDDGSGGRDTFSGIVDVTLQSPFDDVIYGDRRANRLSGGGGRDTIVGGGGLDVINGKPVAGSEPTRIDNRGFLLIQGTAGDDDVLIKRGRREGEVRLYGAPGIDEGAWLSGFAGIRFEGGKGNDRCRLEAGVRLAPACEVELAGGFGNDTLISGRAQTVFEPGPGNDVVQGRGLRNRVDYEADIVGGAAPFGKKTRAAMIRLDMGYAEDPWGGRDRLFGIQDVHLVCNLNDTIQGDARDNRLVSDGGEDLIMGGAGDDVLVAGDLINSPKGTGDTLMGGAGDDYLISGSGYDMLIGEAGRDWYRIGATDPSVDLIVGDRGDVILNIYNSYDPSAARSASALMRSDRAMMAAAKVTGKVPPGTLKAIGKGWMFLKRAKITGDVIRKLSGKR